MPEHPSVLCTIAHPVLLACILLLTSCVQEGGEEGPLETSLRPLLPCQTAQDCANPPPCTLPICSPEGCRFIASSDGCCTKDDDCNPNDPCLLGSCQVAPGATQGSCSTTANPAKPGCCNYIFDCDLPPAGYVTTCKLDAQAGYKKCNKVVDPESCLPPMEHLIINEFMANPAAADDSTGEWIELFNPSLEPVYLNGYGLKDADADDFTVFSATPIVVPPGAYFLLGRSDNPENNGGLYPDYVYYNFTLSNGTDEIILVNPQGVEIDRVEYGPPDFASIEGVSYELASPYMDNNDVVNWRPADKSPVPGMDKGTPGQPNADDFFFYFTPIICNDNNSCTLDTCGDYGEARCRHEPIAECCLYNSDCDDDDLCTIDSCKPASLECAHTAASGCCNVDSDCPQYSSCTYAECNNHHCRDHVKPGNPNCCVVDADCKDANPCTIDYCSQEPGNSYKTCHHTSPGGTQCCMVDLECADGSNDTLDSCVDHECEHLPNPEFCAGPPPAYCNDNDPCTADSCDLNTNLCLHSPIAACCVDDSQCDDGDACTKDLCQSAIHQCAHPVVEGCCHDDDDCTGFLTDQDLCKIPVCVLSKCRLQHLPDADCCLTSMDCDDGDPCTDDVCNPGNNTCANLPKGKGCCQTVADCVADDDPCTESACIANQCVTSQLPGCCKGDWQCEDEDPCTTDVCLDYACRYARDPLSNCCATDSDCQAPCSPCMVATCTAGHFCQHAVAANCTLYPDFVERFSCPGSLAQLGWQQTGGGASLFSRSTIKTPLGVDPALRLSIVADQVGDSACVESPQFILPHPEEPHTVTFEQHVTVDANGEGGSLGTYSLRAKVAGGALTTLASFPGALIQPHRPYMVALPPQVKSGPFKLRFCADIPQGSSATAWTIDTVKLGTGNPPRILSAFDDVAMLPGDLLKWPLVASDADGDALAFYLNGPPSASLGSFSIAPDGAHIATLTLAPKANALLGVKPVRITADDGFFTDRITFLQTVYIPKCQSGADCDDGNFCTEDLCNPVTGCTNTFVDGCCNALTPCDDGDLCTEDLCVDAACVTVPVSCDDNNPCTDDTCHPDQGCAHPFNNEGCDDNSLCTWHDLCYKGSCVGLPVDCSDNLSCTLDACDPVTGCSHKSLCSDSILCTTDICTLKGCKSGKVPVGTPTADGVIDEQWPDSSIQASGQFAIGPVRLLLDEVNLYLGVTFTPLANRGGLIFLDRDFTATTGPADFATVVAEDTGMDLALAPDLSVDFPGFGADFAVGFLWGDDPAAGLVAAGCFQLAANGLAQQVPCLIAVSAEGVAEIALPWYLLFDQPPYEDEIAALVIAAVDSAGALQEAVPAAPLGVVEDLLVFGVPDPMCLVSFCGDAVVDAGELCDDGPKNSDLAQDACRTNCVPAHCGDNVTDSEEECDDGPENANIPDQCRVNCLLPICGDAIIDTQEVCDDGPDNSDELPDACRTNCLPAQCGDGVIDSLEGCDNGPENSDLAPDACRTDCQMAWCGDGTADSDEECDDGPFNSDTEPDACRSNCLEPWCGDGILDAGEECDLAQDNSDSLPDGCRTSCKWAWCDDGVLDSGEECDDGNDLDWDGCQADCTVYVTVCGDGIQTPNEECDDGDANSDSLPDACRTDCLLAHCGDGVVDNGESCDDGNLLGGDDCGLDCQPYVAFCGNNWVDPGEACDDGPDNSNSLPDHCRKDCTQPKCGDNVVDSGEECDKGVKNNDTLANACRTSCLLAHCGDNVKDTGEECDAGPDNADVPNQCKTNCIAPACGDGILDDVLGEECDWAEFNADDVPDSCRTNCLNAHCGDNVVDSGETCDDGPLNSDTVADACRSSCQPAWCGDGLVDSGEECDQGPDNADAANACKTNCVAAKCGDGIVDDALGEACDWAELASDTQPDACRSNCQSAGCGDQVVDTNEECDDGNAILGDGCAPDCTIETYVPDPGDIIITEIMQNPAKVYDTLGEYFEVYNTRDFDIDINGWEISDGAVEKHVIVHGAPLVVPASGCLVLGIESSIELNGGVAVDYQYADILLGNGSDELVLTYKGALSDAVAYDGGPAFPDPKGAAMNLSPGKFNHLLNDSGAAWCEATSPLPSGDFGTPGEPNDMCP